MSTFVRYLLVSLIIGTASSLQAGGKPAAKPVQSKAGVKVDAIAAAELKFSCDLYSRLKQTPGNLVVCPYGLFVQLSLIRTGADGPTRDETTQVLHLTQTNQQIVEQLGALRILLDADLKRPPSEWNAAMLMGIDGSWSWNDKFVENAESAANAQLATLSFQENPQAAAEAVNQWTAANTNGRITQIANPAGFDKRIRLALLNAVYFHAKWQSQFEKEKTKSLPFHLDSMKTVEHPLMYQKSQLGLLNKDTYQVLRMPYRDVPAAMIVALPKEIDGLPALEGLLTSELIQAWLKESAAPAAMQGGGFFSIPPVQLAQAPQQNQSRGIEIWFPRFKMNWQRSLQSDLTALGMPTAFQEDQADIRRMFKRFNGNPIISEVTQKTLLEVDEEGSTAASVTMSKGMGGGGFDGRKFKADHPFLFLIVHEPSGCILFMGRMADPTQQL